MFFFGVLCLRSPLIGTSSGSSGGLQTSVIARKQPHMEGSEYNGPGQKQQNKLEQKRAKTKTSGNNKHFCFDLFILLLFKIARAPYFKCQLDILVSFCL